MRLRRVALLVAVSFAGCVATLFVYAALLVVQIANADDACESYPASVPGADVTDVRDHGFENSFLNLGGRCTYLMNDGSLVVTREPGWWFSGSLVVLLLVFAGQVVYLARRKGHKGWLYGLCTLFAPPLALVLAVVASRKANRPETAQSEEG